MTEESIKEFIKSYPDLKAKRDILDKIQIYSQNAEKDEEYSRITIKIQIIESALEILKENEKKIVLWHLVDEKTWTEIEELHEERAGTKYNYSNRTLKRMQQNALKKMEAFLSKSGFQEYIS